MKKNNEEKSEGKWKSNKSRNKIYRIDSKYIWFYINLKVKSYKIINIWIYLYLVSKS